MLARPGPALPVKLQEYGHRQGETPLMMTDAAFRGRAVEAGRHRVSRRFTPLILVYGLAVRRRPT